MQTAHDVASNQGVPVPPAVVTVTSTPRGMLRRFLVFRHRFTRSQGTEVIGHIAEFLDHFGVAEIARSRITRAAERDGADVPLFARCRSDLAMRRLCSGTPTATLG